MRIRWVILFFLVLGLLNGLYYVDKTLILGVLDQPYTHLVTRSSLYLGHLLLPNALQATGNAIYVENRTTVFIASGCNGLEAIFLMFAGVVAFPASWPQRWRSLCAYLPLIYLLNLLRIVVLVFIAHNHPSYLDVFHYQVAQGVLIVFVLSFWLDHMRRVSVVQAPLGQYGPG